MRNHTFIELKMLLTRYSHRGFKNVSILRYFWTKWRQVLVYKAIRRTRRGEVNIGFPSGSSGCDVTTAMFCSESVRISRSAGWETNSLQNSQREKSLIGCPTCLHISRPTKKHRHFTMSELTPDEVSFPLKFFPSKIRRRNIHVAVRQNTATRSTLCVFKSYSAFLSDED